MKKLILTFAVLGALAVTSCGSSTKKVEDEGASIKAKIENCSDPDSLKIYVRQAQEYADKLVKEGKDADAQAYIDEVGPAIQAKIPADYNIFSELKAEADSAISASTDSVKAKAEAAKEAVKDVAGSAVDATKNAASSAVDAAKQKTSDAVQAGADKIKDVLK